MKMHRRNFLRSSGLLAGGFLGSSFPLVAGPFTAKDFQQAYFPADKKLDPRWIKSLYERGQATVYSKTKNELRYIGMPVGGICCGTLYVGGDGRLWVWDIFNANQLGAVYKIVPLKVEVFKKKEIDNGFGCLYLEPAKDIRPLQQGFALVMKQDQHTIVKRLHQDDWDEVLFEATYPIATIKYIDKSLSLQVTLNSFSPFIPGDAHNSGLPATIQSISLKNLSTNSLEVEIVGWLENKLLLNTIKLEKDFKRINRSFENNYCNGVSLEVLTNNKSLEKAPDFGNMSFAILAKNTQVVSEAAIDAGPAIRQIKSFLELSPDSPIAVLSTSHILKAGEKHTADFIISWYTPNVSLPDNGPGKSTNMQDVDFHYYTAHFANASAVSEYIAKNYNALKQRTFLWKKTWYDSTLPWWFLERTLLNVSTLATTTSHRFQSGRFYAWEGVGCCQGTCTHVYQYAQAMSRIFPELERDMRERVDLGLAFDEPTGMIRYRGEDSGPSIDGQAGTLLRIYREHLMSKDGLMLNNNWNKIKKALEFLMRQDKNGDGMEDTPMMNTLDALWSGEISWIVGLCIAAVLAGQKMAEEMNDDAFAERCKNYVEKGIKNMEQYLFNGEYFIQRADPKLGKKELGSYNTCHIDQVYGQAWAWQAGLGRILDKEKTMSSLHALWKYNYMPDVGPYIKQHPGGRIYALAGEGGMVMNTNPGNEINPYGDVKSSLINYFSECMSGFEHQVASHMMAEGMAEEALVLTRTIHDRYHAFKRNPFNEIECCDHYGRAMASFGTFISASGFTYHGPKGFIGFAPKIFADNFKGPFTAAEGWGSYAQQREPDAFSAQLKVLHGKLRLKKISVELDENFKAGSISVLLNKGKMSCTIVQKGAHCEIGLPDNLVLTQNKLLSFKIEN